MQWLHKRLMKTRGGEELTDARWKPSDSVAAASGSGEERRGAKIGGKLQKQRQQNKLREWVGGGGVGGFCLEDQGRRRRRK